jgi:DNA-directed RNA polymerase subunit RPC12/RpoP
MKDLKIECPKCAWEPDGGAYWMCSKCHHIWNTFDTAAQCPQCHFQHEYTSCIQHQGGCPAYEPHLDWYKNLGDIVQEELDRILVEQEIST